MKSTKFIVLSLLFICSLQFKNHAQTFTQGNIAVLVAAASANNTTCSVVELNPNTASPAVNTFSISGTSSNALRFSGSATSTGYLSNSSDGSLLTFMGANSTNTSSNVNTLNPRGVGTLNQTYTFNLATTYTGVSGNQTRCATTLNNSSWFIADQGGLYTNSSTTPSPAANLRSIKPFGGTVYTMQASSTSTNISVSTIAASTGSSLVGLPGLTNDNSAQDFYIISSGSNGTSYDILYTLSATSNTAGTITKYSLVSGTWTSNGSYSTTFGGFGLAAKKQGSGAYLFVTTGQGALTANSVIRLNDVNGYNSAISITTGNNVNLYTASAGTIIKGVAFAPVNSCVAPSITSLTNNGPVCSGNTLNFNLAVTGSATLSYAWTGPSGFTSGMQNTSISNAQTSASGSYSVTVTNGCGSTNASIDATVHPLPVATITPSGATMFCNGDSVILNASTSASYVWSNSASTSSITATTSGNYTVMVTDSNSCSAVSAPVSVTVNPIVTPSITIAADPGNTICSGTNVLFSANFINEGNDPSFQWTLNGNSVGGDSSSYSNSGLQEGDEIACTLTSNAQCVTSTTALSNTITIHVSSTVTPSVGISADNDSICSGTPVNFTAAPVNGGSTPSYQWKINGINAGSNADTFSSSTLSNADTVSCTMTSSNGCASPATAVSNSISMYVTSSVTPSVTISADPGNTICNGTTVTFTAVPVNGGTPFYQWKKNNVNTGSNASIYIDSTLIDHDTIVCIMTSSLECPTSAIVSSQEITMTVNPVPAPSITGNLAFCTGDSTLLNAGAGFTSYAWSNGETIQTINVSTSGEYSVTVYNGFCSGTSVIVSVSEISTPSQPGAFTASSSNVFNGQNGVIYSVPAVAGVTYTWNYTGTGATINGTSNSVTINFSASATSGILSVTANNSCGTSSSRDIAITVSAQPGTMRITEYMYNGGGAGGAGEYVEFTNIGTTAVDMSGWSFDDNSRVAGSQSLSGFGVVQPGESIVLTELNAGTFRTNWNLCNGVKIVGGNSNNLGREDEINLYNGAGTLIDRLTYGDQTFAPGTIRTQARSGWVNATGLGNNAIAQWTLSTAGDSEASFTSTLAEIGSPGKSTRATVAFNPCIVVNGAPSIVINVNSTFNFVDGGVSVSPASPFGFSGVINDATDPGKIYGIDFTISDGESIVDSLQFTIVSANQSVVPDTCLIVTGNGGSRNVKINPAGVGYSSLTITVSDGTNSTVYIINYAASSPEPGIIPANTFWHTGISDGSDAIPLDNNYYITGDDELNVLNVYSRSESGLPLASYNYTSFLALPEPSNPEVDVEAAARSNTSSGRVYWTGSMSNGKAPYDDKPNRDRLFATTVTGTGASTSFAFVGYYDIKSTLLAWGDSHGYNFTASSAAGVNPKSLVGFSLEGMVFGPDSTTLYLGLRAPLVPTSLRTNAVIAPILNFEAWFNNGSPAGPPVFGNPIELDLDTRGIRDIIRLSNGTYIIIAGSPIEDGGINNIYKWSGYPGDEPIAISNSAGNLLNMEGVMEVNDTTGLSLTSLQIISDGGANILYQDATEAKDFGDLNLRKFRSDVLTNLDLDICSGFTAIITPAGSTSICSGSTAMLSANAGNNVQYDWSNGDSTQIINASIESYSVTISNRAGCSATSLVTTVTNALPSDFNNDSVTNNIDFLQLLGKFNQSCTGCIEDMNHDGIINNIDFLMLLGQFNQTCSN